MQCASGIGAQKRVICGGEACIVAPVEDPQAIRRMSVACSE